MTTCPQLFTFPSISCFCQKGAQVSFAILPLHCPEEKSGRPDCGGILQIAEREAQVHQCTFFIGSHESVVLCNNNLLNSFLGYVWRANTLPTRIMSANYFHDNKALITDLQLIFFAHRTNLVMRPSPSLKRQPNWGEQTSSRRPWEKSDTATDSDEWHELVCVSEKDGENNCSCQNYWLVPHQTHFYVSFVCLHVKFFKVCVFIF